MTLALDSTTLLIVAKDNGVPSLSATLTLTINVLPAAVTLTSELYLSVEEEVGEGTVLGVVTSPLSHPPVTYSITSGNYG